MGPPILVRAALLFLIVAAALVTPADADLWGHLAFGRDILADRNPVQVDRYSFTTDRDWINHEWLSEATFSAVYGAGGSPALILFKVAVITAVLAATWRHLRRFAGADLSMVLVFLTFAGSYWRTHNVRPQLFSVLLFAALLLCLTAADAGRKTRLLLVPAVFALWVNLHGGWIVGLATYGVWTVARLADSQASPRDRLVRALIGLAAVAATLLNPWGVRLWMFLAETVRLRRVDIEEWSSIAQSPLVLGVSWAITVIVGVAAIWRWRLPVRRDYLAVIAGLCVLSFLVSRLDAFFVLALVILLAPQLARLWIPRPATAATSSPSGAVFVTIVAVLATALPVLRFAAPYSTCIPISGAWAPDARAAQVIADSRLSGRLLTWFDWGEYAIWHFAPGLKVSMDGRRETVYTDEIIQAHRRLYAGDPTSLGYLNELQADFAWLPNQLPLNASLATAGWTQVFRGSLSSIWARTPMTLENGAVSPVPIDDLRCFPGP